MWGHTYLFKFDLRLHYVNNPSSVAHVTRFEATSLSFFFFGLFVFLGPHAWHMEVPG